MSEDTKAIQSNTAYTKFNAYMGIGGCLLFAVVIFLGVRGMDDVLDRQHNNTKQSAQNKDRIVVVEANVAALESRFSLLDDLVSEMHKAVTNINTYVEIQKDREKRGLPAQGL